MAALVKTNPYINQKRNLHRLIEADTRQSCAFEGARVSVSKSHVLRRPMTSAKKAVKGS